MKGAQVLVVIVLVAAIGGPALSAPARINISTQPGKDTAASVAAADAALGYDLADYARRTRDAAMMIQAAKIYRDIPPAVSTTEGVLEREDGSVVSPKAPEDPVPSGSFQSLLGEARRFARGNRELLRQIAEVEASAGRGIINGAVHRYRDVPPRNRWSISVVARGGEVLSLAARGDGRTNVDMFVYDESGQEVCRDTDPDPSPSCRVTPRWTGAFKVRMDNLGYSWTRISFLSN